MKSLFTILFISLVFTSSLLSCNKPETAEIEKTLTDFYAWYFDAIDKEDYLAYKPSFISDENGKSTLDFGIYLANLERLHFSKALIEEERASYQDCLAHLAEIEFATLNQTLGELDQSEAIGCDFGNQFRWIGGQENAAKTINLLAINIVNTNKAKVEVAFLDKEGNLIGSKTVLLKNKASIWEIEAFE